MMCGYRHQVLIVHQVLFVAQLLLFSTVVHMTCIKSSLALTLSTNFFNEQLDICKQIANDSDDYNVFPLQCSNDMNRRSRFKEHPRCTARFGEVLYHARDSSVSIEEYQKAIHNAKSILNYIDACMHQSNNLHPIREGLLEDITAALTSKGIREFRVKQIECDKSESDFTPEQSDLEILGRLYYSALSRTEQYLQEVGLTVDHCGFTTLLALCRAVSDSSLTYTKDGERLDAAVSNHFNGITAPGCRFLYSSRHGIDDTNKTIGRSKRLIVAFSSLGNGLVRHEFGGSLAKINNQLYTDGLYDDVCDVLFVADPSQSWYQKDSRGTFDGFEEYEQRIQAASMPYEKVSCIGDSMGGSGALLFSHLSTESVVAFSPQVDLEGDVHVSRYDMTPIIRHRYYKRLLESVEQAVANEVNVFVHRGVEKLDIRHTDLLLSRFSEMSSCLKVIQYEDCSHHQIAVHLKQQGMLAQVLQSNLINNRRI